MAKQITVDGVMYVSQAESETAPYKIGQAYLIRTVTMAYTGKVIAVYPQELVLSEAAWIADTGRYGTALKDGVLNEVELMIGEVVIGRGAIVDAAEWYHSMPNKTL